MSLQRVWSRFVGDAFPAGNRDFGLDLLRAMAIAMVLVFHGVGVRGVPFVGAWNTGVDLFFVLSGFLIGRIFFRSVRREDFGLMEFWQARWLRTIPPYLVMLALYSAAYGLPSVSYLWFGQNYAGMSGFGISWSLCVEEHFYVVFPVVGILAVRRLPGTWIPSLIGMAIVMPWCARVVTYLVVGRLPEGWWFMTHYHSEALAIGVGLAHAHVNCAAWLERSRTVAKWLVALGALAMVLEPSVAGRAPLFELSYYLIVSLGYGALLLLVVGRVRVPERPLGRLASTVVQVVALSSYSLYLTHTMVDAWVRNGWLASMPRGVAKTSLVFGCVLLAGLAFYLLIEHPTTLLRNHLRRQRRTCQAPGSKRSVKALA